MAVTATKNITQNKGNGTSKASNTASSVSSSAGGGAAGARFRQRKISTKQPLTIYRQKELPSVDINNELEQSHVHHLYNGATGSVSLSGTAVQKRDLHAMETGVDKNEEDEVHLQQVINAAQQALSNESKKPGESSEFHVYIPTPDASKVWPDAHKYYGDMKYVEPDSYVKFSATIEDTVSVEYNIDEVDEEFLAQMNNGVKNSCSELEFEIVCDKFEKLIEEKQPFLSMDPSNILSFKELMGYILDEYNSSGKFTSTTNYILTVSLKDRLSKELQYKPFVTLFDKPNPEGTKEPRSVSKLLSLFGEKVYDHWKQRKIERRGKSIVPSLKFEDPNATEKDNDNDPYICFRRREFRQARKTRRADTIGGERIRLLQKSLHRARDLVMSVCKREILRLQSLEAENEIFKLRCEGKSLKRTVGVKGDDYLFYPHKRKKVVKPKPKEDEVVSKATSHSNNQGAQQLRKDHGHSHAPSPATAGVSTANNKSVQHIQDQTSSTQPYVKLPPSKIPDMDLITVQLVLKEKNENIKRAVLDKLRKRREMDKGYINATDDPYEPYFNISTNEVQELSHIPYSSVAASSFHEFITSNYIDNNMKHLLDEGDKPLSLMKTFKGSTGELAPSKPFPHLQTFMENDMNTNNNGYIAQLLHNIETNNFNVYSNGYSQTHQSSSYSQNQGELSEPVFKLRKRMGRGGMFIDRRGLSDVDVESLFEEEPTDITPEGSSSRPPEAYNCQVDAIKRLESRWKFDNDLSENDTGLEKPFSLDPSKLNCISNDTQSIRFGSMLLAKSYDLLREAVQQKQQAFMQQRMRAHQQQSSTANRNNLLYSQQIRKQVASAPTSGNPKTTNLVEQKKTSTSA